MPPANQQEPTNELRHDNKADLASVVNLCVGPARVGGWFKSCQLASKASRQADLAAVETRQHSGAMQILAAFIQAHARSHPHPTPARADAPALRKQPVCT